MNTNQTNTETATTSTYLPWPEYKAKLIAEGKWTPKMVDDGNGNLVEKTYDRDYLPRGQFFAQLRAEGKLPARKLTSKQIGAIIAKRRAAAAAATAVAA